MWILGLQKQTSFKANTTNQDGKSKGMRKCETGAARINVGRYTRQNTRLTQDAKILASSDSWKSDPGRTWQVKALSNILISEDNRTNDRSMKIYM